MKKMNALVLILCAGFSLLFSACSDNEVIRYHTKIYKSMLTVKVSDDSYHFENDKGKIFSSVYPLKGYSPKKDHRAFVYYEVALEKDCDNCDYPIYVHRIDTILSKKPAENLEGENKKVYGDDPVEIDRIFISGGFLNIRFGTYWGGHKAHFVNLIQEKEDDLTYFRFRQNAYDDPKYYWGYGWVSFDLTDILSGTEENTFSIEVNTYKGVVIHKLSINTEEVEENAEETEATVFSLS